MATSLILNKTDASTKLLCKLHNKKNIKNFLKPLDKHAVMCYTIDTKREDNTSQSKGDNIYERLLDYVLHEQHHRLPHVGCVHAERYAHRSACSHRVGYHR